MGKLTCDVPHVNFQKLNFLWWDTSRVKFHLWPSFLCSYTCSFPIIKFQMQYFTCKNHMWKVTYELSHVKFQSLLTCRMWNFTFGISRVEICHTWNFTCEISHVKFHMWNSTCEISHVKFHMWNFTCEISHVKNMSHVKHMGFEIHMCYWNFTCESHVNHMGNTSQFSVRGSL